MDNIAPISEVHRERNKPTLGRLLVTGLTVVNGVLAPIATWYITAVLKPYTWTWADLGMVWLAHEVATALGIFCEWFVYDSMRRNWASLRANGYSPGRILAHVLTLLAGAVLVPILLGAYNGEKAAPRPIDTMMMVRFVGMVIASDVLWFRNAHLVLHRYVPSIHYLHHCCFVPSFSCNYCFNVLDFSLEFGGPLALAFAAFKTDLIGQRDEFAFTLFAVFMQLFYMIDHDRLIQDEHFRHHTLLNCNYYIYNQKTQPRDPLETMRKTIKRIGNDKLQ